MEGLESILEPYMLTEAGVSWQMLVTMLLTSFVLCQLIAAVYTWTFRGLSYSRGFVISLALTGLIATILMLAIGNNVARGLGLLGTLAIIRFRSTMRDVRDMIFIFASLAVGISVGVQALAIALFGTLAFCLFTIHLTWSPFASRKQFDGLLRLNTPSDPDVDTLLKRVLRDHCSNFVLVNLREVAQGERLDQAYQVKLREASYQQHLVTSIGSIADVSDISLLMQDPVLEV